MENILNCYVFFFSDAEQMAYCCMPVWEGALCRDIVLKDCKGLTNASEHAQPWGSTSKLQMEKALPVCVQIKTYKITWAL